MTIRASTIEERDALLDVWLRSVRATHHFLAEEDIEFFLPFVREALVANGLERWTLVAADGTPAGFMLLDGEKLEALFLAPEYRGRGEGRRLLEHALARGVRAVDVNEQNAAAVRFYERCGFVVTGRSPLDGTGRPFPLLHMRIGD
ncbi:MAG TPA: acetyltransferase [Gemmatimonadaceae bacterium]|nr:acetyltransferase [Gemmatimonadaceae bacterium]